MKCRIALFLISLISLSCSRQGSMTVVVSNSTDLDRVGEVVEVEGALLRERFMGDKQLVVRCAATGDEIASQWTYDDKLIFQSSVAGRCEQRYFIEAGEPREYQPKVFGQQYPARVDDFAWESDCMAYRTYGPALQASGERAFGYDVWVKNTPRLVVDERYRKELEEGISYHVDHGDGLDCYKVGPTLGAGTAALMVGDEVVYPYCYKSYEVLDNGPLRLTFALEYNALEVGDDDDVVERRVISIDAGSHLNKTTVTYTNLTRPTPIIVGLVMQDPEGVSDYFSDPESRYASYATDCGKNGIIYIGSIVTQPSLAIKTLYFDRQESVKLRGRAKGHLVTMSQYIPDMEYVYYWGASWSKAGFDSHDEWQSYLQESSKAIDSPMMVTLQ